MVDALFDEFLFYSNLLQKNNGVKTLSLSL